MVGSINRDYIIQTATRPEPGETITGARLSIASGGKGANQAVAAALLGVPIRLIAEIGDDVTGRELLIALRAAGIETADVIGNPSAATGAAFITITPDGENAIVVASGANSLLGSAELQAKRSVLEAADLLLLQLEVPDEAIETATQLVGSETLVILNAAPYRELSQAVMRRVDVLVVNAVEARQLLGYDSSLEDGAAFARIGARATVVTLGSVGVRAFVGSRILQHDSLQRRVVDTTGAGDAFVGALGAWLAREPVGHSDDIDEALARALPAASIAAAYSVQRLGAQSSYGTCDELGPPWS